MVRSGEIVGIALPFAAGVGSAAIILTYTHMPLMTAGGIAVICVVVIAMLLAAVGSNAQRCERRWSDGAGSTKRRRGGPEGAKCRGGQESQNKGRVQGMTAAQGSEPDIESGWLESKQKSGGASLNAGGARRVNGDGGCVCGDQGLDRGSGNDRNTGNDRDNGRNGAGVIDRDKNRNKNRGRSRGEVRDKWYLSAAFALAGAFCYLAAACRGASAEEGMVMQAAGRCADRLREIIDSIPFGHEQSAALIKALLTGERSSLSRATVLAFRASGASHLLALSGLHLGFIYLIIRRICNLIPWRGPTASRIRATITIGLCGFYTLMTGAGASIVRAFLFICIRETAGICPERKSVPGRTLLWALTIQLALSPTSIASIGFQLSYLAMAGITFILPWMQSWYPPSKDPVRKLWDTAALSISCQITTAPLAWWHFRTFPQYFLITNIIAMPLCSTVMSLSIATVALYAMGICPEWLIMVTDLSVQSIIAALRIISEM